ncbi:spore coat protein CotH [Acetobacterium malicum]|uniref:Spore coat protein CotH n=1 Tax=Acetobacterium malicum TaxID=52692 RepID=A0ABR6YXH5_9FIRM|nr:CotH kinase family protein [Acetobacterium malicum]MBC3899812.1 spore coat protein CotH [Acetobacterium malicum]
MADHKNIERICIIIGIVTMIIGIGFAYFGESFGITAGTSADLSYVTTLFDDTVVHTIDIEIAEADWNSLQENAAAEEYQLCAVTVDGEKLDNVAIRPKGNSSLSSVVSSDSERYSFKIDFDKYSDGLTYHGLDKLNLNNIISDNTYLKEYLSYDMMAYMGVAAPLASFVKVSVNGEYFGLYLAVEGVEEAFAERNYGSDEGNIYKPDSMQIGGDNEMGGDKPDMTNMPELSQMPDMNQVPDQSSMPDFSQMGNMGGASGNDVALIYSDDELSIYENIWQGAVFDVTSSDKERLINSIKQLNAGENLEEVVDVEAVLKYFVVHNFVDNYDSYTGSMKHNYYLREEDGQLSMIAWDYNLAFCNFSGGGMGGGTKTTTASTDEATTLLNYPIDTPVSGTTMDERPLLNELLSNEEYLEQYHQYFQGFIAGYFESGQCTATIDQATALISDYVKDDPTAFCTYEEYQAGVAVLEQFCTLRAESISGQLNGTIPATTEGQAADPTALLDGSSLNISALGSSMGGGMDKNRITPTGQGTDQTASSDPKASAQTTTATTQQPAKGQPPNRPDGDTTSAAAPPQPVDSSESTTTAENQTGDRQAAPISENGLQNDRTIPNGATATNWDIQTLILFGGSCLLLVMAILVTKIYKR